MNNENSTKHSLTRIIKNLSRQKAEIDPEKGYSELSEEEKEKIVEQKRNVKEAFKKAKTQAEMQVAFDSNTNTLPNRTDENYTKFRSEMASSISTRLELQLLAGELSALIEDPDLQISQDEKANLNVLVAEAGKALINLEQCLGRVQDALSNLKRAKLDTQVGGTQLTDETTNEQPITREQEDLEPILENLTFSDLEATRRALIEWGTKYQESLRLKYGELKWPGNYVEKNEPENFAKQKNNFLLVAAIFESVKLLKSKDTRDKSKLSQLRALLDQAQITEYGDYLRQVSTVSSLIQEVFKVSDDDEPAFYFHRFLGRGAFNTAIGLILDDETRKKLTRPNDTLGKVPTLTTGGHYRVVVKINNYSKITGDTISDHKGIRTPAVVRQNLPGNLQEEEHIFPGLIPPTPILYDTNEYTLYLQKWGEPVNIDTFLDKYGSDPQVLENLQEFYNRCYEFSILAGGALPGFDTTIGGVYNLGCDMQFKGNAGGKSQFLFDPDTKQFFINDRLFVSTDDISPKEELRQTLIDQLAHVINKLELWRKLGISPVCTKDNKQELSKGWMQSLTKGIKSVSPSVFENITEQLGKSTPNPTVYNPYSEVDGYKSFRDKMGLKDYSASFDNTIFLQKAQVIIPDLDIHQISNIEIIQVGEDLSPQIVEVVHNDITSRLSISWNTGYNDYTLTINVPVENPEPETNQPTDEAGLVNQSNPTLEQGRPVHQGVVEEVAQKPVTNREGLAPPTLQGQNEQVLIDKIGQIVQPEKATELEAVASIMANEQLPLFLIQDLTDFVSDGRDLYFEPGTTAFFLMEDTYNQVLLNFRRSLEVRLISLKNFIATLTANTTITSDQINQVKNFFKQLICNKIANRYKEKFEDSFQTIRKKSDDDDFWYKAVKPDNVEAFISSKEQLYVDTLSEKMAAVFDKWLDEKLET